MPSETGSERKKVTHIHIVTKSQGECKCNEFLFSFHLLIHSMIQSSISASGCKNVIPKTNTHTHIHTFRPNTKVLNFVSPVVLVVGIAAAFQLVQSLFILITLNTSPKGIKIRTSKINSDNYNKNLC